MHGVPEPCHRDGRRKIQPRTLSSVSSRSLSLVTMSLALAAGMSVVTISAAPCGISRIWLICLPPHMRGAARGA